MAEALGSDNEQVSAQPPFEEDPRAGGNGSDEENMSNVRLLLVERMDPDFGLLDKLLQLGALNYSEKGRIKSEKSIFDRNDKLLELIFNKMKHQALLAALTDTGQKHLFNLVRGNGGYRPEFDAVWPLRERETQILDANCFNLVDIIDPCDLITRMFSKGVINNRQHMYINSLLNNAEKAEALLDILRRGSEEYYMKTVLCLRESNQSDVAEILMYGGVLTRVHVSNEGKTEQVNEEEDHILEALTNLLQNTTLPQYQRIRERLDLQIMRAQKGQSIVLYIYCKTLEELLYLYELLTKGEFKKRIATVFDLLILKRETTVSAVNWSEDEFTRFKAYFKGDLQDNEKVVKKQKQSSGETLKNKKIAACVGAMGLRDRIEAHKELITDRLDPDFGLLDKLLASRSLTRPEVVKVKALSDSYGRSKKLMEYVSDKGIYEQFFNALRDTQQTHLVNFILSNGERRPEFGDDWPLTEREISILDTNQHSWVDLLDTYVLLRDLYSHKVVNNRQRDFVSSKTASHEKNEALLEILRRTSLQKYKEMIYCLHLSRQSHIADLLKEGGGVVRVRSELETESDVNEVEDELIRKITEILGDPSLRDSARILECTQLRLNAVKKGVVRVRSELETKSDVPEVEDELITKFTEMLGDRSLRDSTRILECTELRLIAAKKGN